MDKNNKTVHPIYSKVGDFEPVGNKSKLPSSYDNDEKLCGRFSSILSEKIINFQKLQQLSWTGIPIKYRALVWKILLRYVPLNSANIEETLRKKRSEFQELIKLYYTKNKDNEFDDGDAKIIKLISNDVIRTQPEAHLFHHPAVEALLKKILYIWHIRHPASGYAQGINEVAVPLFAVFLNEKIPLNFKSLEIPEKFTERFTPEIISDLEADTYWCLCKIMDGILDNYTPSQPGMQRGLMKIKEIIKRVDAPLFTHMETHEVNFLQFGVRWIFCLLVREFHLSLAIRLFDTYIADQDGFNTLNTYTCASFILKNASSLKKKDFGDMIQFLQNIPTHDWSEEDVQGLLAEAYVYKSMFEAAPGHFKDMKG